MTVYIAGKCGDHQPDELIDQLADCFVELGYNLLDWRTLPVTKPYLNPSECNTHSAEKMLDWAYSSDAFVLIGHGQNYMAHIELGVAIASLRVKPKKKILVLLAADVRQSLAYCHSGITLVRTIDELGGELRQLVQDRTAENYVLTRNLNHLYQIYGQQMKAVEQKDRSARP
jgi:hypothetical protein